MTSELFSSVYKEKSDHLFDDRIFSCPVPAFTHWSIFVPLSENPYISRLFRIPWVIPIRCRDLHLKQFCLEDIVPAVLIILITHIILAVRWMLIKILSVVINHHGRGNTVVSGGCHPNNNIIRKIDQKSKMGLSHFVTLILYSVYRHARYCGYYN